MMYWNLQISCHVLLSILLNLDRMMYWNTPQTVYLQSEQAIEPRQNDVLKYVYSLLLQRILNKLNLDRMMYWNRSAPVAVEIKKAIEPRQNDVLKLFYDCYSHFVSFIEPRQNDVLKLTVSTANTIFPHNWT